MCVCVLQRAHEISITQWVDEDAALAAAASPHSPVSSQGGGQQRRGVSADFDAFGGHPAAAAAALRRAPSLPDAPVGGGMITAIAFPPGEKEFFAAATDAGVVYLCSVTTGTRWATLTGHTGAVTAIDWAAGARGTSLLQVGAMGHGD
jgi:hypothetical protein